MRIVFFGTSEFAVPALKKLHESGNFEIVAVVTQPDKPAGRKQYPLPSPVKTWALEHGLKVFQSTSPLPPPQAWGGIKGGVDLAIVASYGKIITKEILDFPKYGSINIHPSLLPKYRGPSPIHAAILNGDSESGVTIMKMDEQLDHGPILESRISNIEYRDNYLLLHNKLSVLGAELLMETLPKYVSGEIKPVPQDDSKATFTKLITKDDARIDWGKSTEDIDRMVRAYHVWPVAWTVLDGKRLKIFECEIVPSPGEGRVPKAGEVEIENNNLLVHCGQGILEIKSLQMEGGKKLTAAQFISGYRNLSGIIFK